MYTFDSEGESSLVDNVETTDDSPSIPFIYTTKRVVFNKHGQRKETHYICRTCATKPALRGVMLPGLPLH